MLQGPIKILAERLKLMRQDCDNATHRARAAQEEADGYKRHVTACEREIVQLEHALKLLHVNEGLVERAGGPVDAAAWTGMGDKKC